MNRYDSFDEYMNKGEEKLLSSAEGENENFHRQAASSFEERKGESAFEESSFENEAAEEDEELVEYGEVSGKGFGEEVRYDEIFDKNNPKTMGFSVVSVILGALSVLFGWVVFLGVVFGAAAVVFSAISRKTLRYFDKMAIAGLILGIFGVVFGASAWILKSLVII